MQRVVFGRDGNRRLVIGQHDRFSDRRQRRRSLDQISPLELQAEVGERVFRRVRSQGRLSGQGGHGRVVVEFVRVQGQAGVGRVVPEKKFRYKRYDFTVLLLAGTVFCRTFRDTSNRNLIDNHL